MKFRILPVRSEIADAVRGTLHSPQYGHPAFVETATGYGPCRVCLRTFAEGSDQRILFTYNAFEGLLDVPLPGPVFIHREDCLPYSGNGFPDELLGIPILFEAYGSDGTVISTVKMDGETADDQLDAILSRSETHFVNIRNAEAGCHIARAVRA